MFTASIFDTITPNKKYNLWKKESPDHKNTASRKAEFTAYKRSSSNPTGGLNKRFFFFQDRFLCYKKRPTSKKISGILDLEWARCEFQTLSEEKTGRPVFEIKILKNLRFTCVYIDCESSFNMVKSELSKNCHLTDFGQRFQVVDIIGVGGFASVRYFFEKNLILRWCL